MLSLARRPPPPKRRATGRDPAPPSAIVEFFFPIFSSRVLGMNPITKRCTRCLQTKDTDQFYQNAKRKDGLSGECKPCWDERMAVGRRKKRAEKAREHLGPAGKAREEFKDGAQTLPYAFKPRGYQLEVEVAWSRGLRRFVTVWPRGGGKDQWWLNFMWARLQ